MIGAHVPDANRALVTDGKVRDYLLAAEHPDNGGKAGFFARFGFNRLRWGELHTALVMHLSDNLVVAASPAGGGSRVRIRCNMSSSDGRGVWTPNLPFGINVNRLSIKVDKAWPQLAA